MADMETLQKNVKNAFGSQGEKWLSSLPAIIEDLTKQWNLTQIMPVDNMSWNYVAMALDSENQPVVLKLGCDKQVIVDEYEALTHFNGQGAVKVINFNVDTNTILLTRAMPGISLKDDNKTNVEEKIVICAEIIKNIAKIPTSKKSSFKHVANWLAVIDDIDTNLIDKKLVAKAKELRQEVLDSMQDTYVCHGDLHMENIVSNDKKWLSIDPKGIIGDIAFEATALDLITNDEMVTAAKIDILLTERTALLANALDINVNYLRNWIFLRVIISAQWFIEDKGDPSHMLNMAQHLYLLM